MELMKAPVEYRRPTFEELCRQFDCVHPSYQWIAFESVVTVRAPVGGSQERVFSLVMPWDNRDIRTTLIALWKRGQRPGTYEELLSFDRVFRAAAGGYPVVALGSLGSRGRKAPMIYVPNGKYTLDFTWVGHDTHELCRILVVHDHAR
ncbi:hypothetical protein EDM68_04555 [Candidatus Uhrbacteria bacterium]|nr:MAG: hypothetical protein EDM68_04555 [Candidatus Uhrbacteria bacterium]